MISSIVDDIMTLDQKIHIALTPGNLTDDYNRNAGVVLLSLLEHCSKQVVAHILYDERLSLNKEKDTEYNIQCYQEIADRFRCDIRFHHVTLPDWITKLPGIAHYTTGSIMRLCLPNLLPDIESIVYLDCDMVVLTDIAKIWTLVSETDRAGAYWEQINETEINRNRLHYYKKTGISTEKYFNSGALYLNLKQLRKENFETKIFDFLKNNPKTLLPDQDALNWYFNGDYVDIGRQYNTPPKENAPKMSFDNCIIHYWRVKPWNRYYGEVDDWYWEYLEKTPWCKNKKIFYQYLRKSPITSELFDSISKNIFKYLDGNSKDKLKFILKFLWSTTWNSLKHTITVLKRELGQFL